MIRHARLPYKMVDRQMEGERNGITCGGKRRLDVSGALAGVDLAREGTATPCALPGRSSPTGRSKRSKSSGAGAVVTPPLSDRNWHLKAALRESAAPAGELVASPDASPRTKARTRGYSELCSCTAKHCSTIGANKRTLPPDRLAGGGQVQRNAFSTVLLKRMNSARERVLPRKVLAYETALSFSTYGRFSAGYSVGSD